MERGQLGVRGGFLAPNEPRRWENLEPMEGGDTPFMQHQDYPLAVVAKRKLIDEVAPAPASSAKQEDDAMEEARALIEYIREGIRAS
jgi:hypothetical protein